MPSWSCLQRGRLRRPELDAMPVSCATANQASWRPGPWRWARCQPPRHGQPPSTTGLVSAQSQAEAGAEQVSRNFELPPRPPAGRDRRQTSRKHGRRMEELDLEIEETPAPAHHSLQSPCGTRFSPFDRDPALLPVRVEAPMASSPPEVGRTVAALRGG